MFPELNERTLLEAVRAMQTLGRMPCRLGVGDSRTELVALRIVTQPPFSRLSVTYDPDLAAGTWRLEGEARVLEGT